MHTDSGLHVVTLSQWSRTACRFAALARRRRAAGRHELHGAVLRLEHLRRRMYMRDLRPLLCQSSVQPKRPITISASP